ncbi:unnamed protein product [Caenorhabditis bovis]|uniref:Methyltransferase type 11 domain-containing protein n=1 Tax=Caenorhabditis bovis TaxID=2654633 RepID=A0A8S1EYX7_9PELO|nr:unnamed protein product [Caenorhabditis bovis]
MAAKLLANSFKLATSDLANQYALPVKSMTGYVVSKMTARKSKRLNELLIQKHMNVTKDDFCLEIGYGRGDAIKLIFDRVSSGNGAVFGVERSGYMDECTRKRFDLEIAETGQIRIDSTTDLRNLPYPNEIFDHIFHVDVFYFWRHEHLDEINREFLRVMKPGGSVHVGMQFSRLESLTSTNILDRSQWDPMRYLESLENARFDDVQITYHNDTKIGEYQIISAKRPSKSLDDEDADEILAQLAMDIKKERLAMAMLQKNGKID